MTFSKTISCHVKWAAVKEVLDKEALKCSYIDLERFVAICKANGIEDQQSALLVSRYFHEIGSLIHYSEDTTSPLYKLVILQRKWATEATYRVILDKQIREEQNGRFTKADLQRIWSEADYQKMSAELLDLLKKFEICYELPNSQPSTFLIPQCLNDQYPDSIDQHWEKPLSIRYQYEFLPYGVINRLAVRLHRHIADNQVWKKGMILEKDAGRAVVEEVKNINKGFIRITVSGNQTDRWYLQQKIMEQIDDLNQIFNLRESTAIQVPCTCAACQDRKEPHLHNYQILVEMLGEQIKEERCGIKPFKHVPILELIDHAFFTRPKAVEQSLKSKHGFFKDLHINKLIIGNNHEKNQEITATDTANVQVAEGEGQHTIEQSSTASITDKTNLLEYFRIRQLLGWTVGAICAAVLLYWLGEPVKAYSGLVFVAIFGWGAYRSLTSESKYLRYSKWVLGFGLSVTGLLNGLPAMAGTFLGGAVSDNGFIRFLVQFKMDEQPWITLVILLLTFALAAFLVYKDREGE